MITNYKYFIILNPTFNVMEQGIMAAESISEFISCISSSRGIEGSSRSFLNKYIYINFQMKNSLYNFLCSSLQLQILPVS